MHPKTIPTILGLMKDLSDGNHGQSELRVVGEHISNVYFSEVNNGFKDVAPSHLCNAIISSLDELADAVDYARKRMKLIKEIDEDGASP